jgi:hypothetical protein
MSLSVAVDLVVAILLVATIFYAIKLNRRLGILRGDRAELQSLVQNLAVASQHAEAGIAALKVAAEDIGRRLEKKVEEALSLREDLAYMIDGGSVVADRLEGTIRARRDESKVEPMRQRAVERTPAGRQALAERPHAVEASPVDARSRREIRPAAGTVPAPAVVDRAFGEPAAVPSASSRAERNLVRALINRS